MMPLPFTTLKRFAGLSAPLLLALAALAIGGAAWAQPQPADPPGRVARLSELSGQVWLFNPDTNEWVTAERNRPLTTGDRLATDAGARAQLEIGSTTLRLDASTELDVVNLDDDNLALQLIDGSVAARVRDDGDASQFEMSTDEGRFVLQRAGSYRFDHADATSHATVYSGQARYEGGSTALDISAGQHAQFTLDASGGPQYSLSAPVNDAFAAFINERDRVVAASVSERYVSPEMTGADQLDQYGRWEQNPDYGAVWIPTAVAADWAPYSQGHWTFVVPWGWTWVDDAPWGFAPFHYGRWVYARNNWCWTPGARVRRPVYAPALVAWVGAPQASVSVSVGGPAVGWFPLAPREVYVPSYRVSPRYVQNINITHVTNVSVINNVYNNPQAPREYENRRFPHAITVVPAGVLTDRRPVAPAAAQLRNTPWVRDLSTQPGRATALLSAPVTAPPVVARGPDRREGGAPPPPPGFKRTAPFAGPRTVAPQAGAAAPNAPTAAATPNAPPRAEPGNGDRRPPPGSPRRPGAFDERAPNAAAPATPAAPQPVQPARPGLPQPQPAPQVATPAAPPPPAGPQPGARPAPPTREGLASPAPAPAPQQMRPMPLRSADERPAGGRRFDDRRPDAAAAADPRVQRGEPPARAVEAQRPVAPPPPRSAEPTPRPALAQPAAAPQPQQPQQPRAAFAQPQVRQPEAPRPAEVARPARPVEGQRPAAPEAQRPAVAEAQRPVARPEPAQKRAEPVRDDPRRGEQAR